jgi:hypothetical protein
MATLTKPNQPDKQQIERSQVPSVTRPTPEEPGPGPGPAPEEPGPYEPPPAPHNPPPKPDKPHAGGHKHKNIFEAIRAHPGLPDKPDFSGGLGYEGHKGLKGYGLRGHGHGHGHGDQQ